MNLNDILREINDLNSIERWYWGSGIKPYETTIEAAKQAAIKFWNRGFYKIDSFPTLDGKIELIVGNSITQIID
jgi:hypothetical protein